MQTCSTVVLDLPRRAAARTLSLNTPRYGLREKIGHPAHARRDETAFRPDDADVSDVAYIVLENPDVVRRSEFIGERDPGEQANSGTGENGSPDRFDTVGRKVSTNGHAESTLWTGKGPIRGLRQPAI